MPDPILTDRAQKFGRNAMATSAIILVLAWVAYMARRYHGLFEKLKLRMAIRGRSRFGRQWLPNGKMKSTSSRCEHPVYVEFKKGPNFPWLAWAKHTNKDKYIRKWT